MLMHHAPPLHVMDYVGPAIGAVLFVLIMSRVKEPARRRFNAIFVAGAGDFRRDLGAEIASHEVETEIESRCGAG